jgi:LemA protein
MRKKNNMFFVLAMATLLSSCGYNAMVGKDEGVKKAWADVETQYQRRNDLIGNLVETVKGYANFEKETLTAVIEARSKASSINLNADEITPETLEKYQEAQSSMSGALQRLMVVVERYPDLKANANFMALQAELERTENRISVARRDYNAAVADYNTYIRSFPHVLYASWFKFTIKTPFKSESGAEKAPKVDFSK